MISVHDALSICLCGTYILVGWGKHTDISQRVKQTCKIKLSISAVGKTHGTMPVWRVDLEDSLNSLPLPISTHFAIYLYNSSHCKVTSVFLLFEPMLALWLPLANSGRRDAVTILKLGLKRLCDIPFFCSSAFIMRTCLTQSFWMSYMEQSGVSPVVPAKALDTWESPEISPMA